jgi:hypothetical protein
VRRQKGKYAALEMTAVNEETGLMTARLLIQGARLMAHRSPIEHVLPVGRRYTALESVAMKEQMGPMTVFDFLLGEQG